MNERNPIKLWRRGSLRRCVATALLLCYVYPVKAFSPLEAKGWSLIDPPDNPKKDDYTFLNIGHGFAFRHSGLLFNVLALEVESSNNQGNSKESKQDELSGDDSGFLPDSYRLWARNLFKQEGGDYIPSTGGTRISPYLTPHLVGEIIGLYMTDMATVSNKNISTINLALFTKVLLKDEGFIAALKKQRKSFCNNDKYRPGAFSPVKSDGLSKSEETAYGLMKKEDKKALCRKDSNNNYAFDLQKKLIAETKDLKKRTNHRFFNKLFLDNIRTFLTIFERQPKAFNLMVIRTLQSVASFKILTRQHILQYYEGLKQGIDAYEDKNKDKNTNESKGKFWLNTKNFTKPNRSLLSLKIAVPQQDVRKKWLKDRWSDEELKRLMHKNYSVVEEVNTLFRHDQEENKPKSNELNIKSTARDIKNNKKIQEAYDKLLASRLYMNNQRELMVFPYEEATVSGQTFLDCAENAYLNFLKNAFLKRHTGSRGTGTGDNNNGQESKEDEGEEMEEEYIFAVEDMKALGASEKLLKFFGKDSYSGWNKLNQSYKKDQAYRDDFAEVVSGLEGVDYVNATKKIELEPTSENFLKVLQKTLFEKLGEKSPKNWSEVANLLLVRLGGNGFRIDVRKSDEVVFFVSQGMLFSWSFGCQHSVVKKRGAYGAINKKDGNYNLEALFRGIPELGSPFTIVENLQDIKWSNQLQWVELFKLYHANTPGNAFDRLNEYYLRIVIKNRPAILYLMQKLQDDDKVEKLLIAIFNQIFEDKRLIESLISVMEHNNVHTVKIAGLLSSVITTRSINTNSNILSKGLAELRDYQKVYYLLMQALWKYSPILLFGEPYASKYEQVLHEYFDAEFGKEQKPPLSYGQVYNDFNLALVLPTLSKTPSDDPVLIKYKNYRSGYDAKVRKVYDEWLEVFEENPGVRELQFGAMGRLNGTFKYMLAGLAKEKYGDKFSPLREIIIVEYPIDEEAGMNFSKILKNIQSKQRLQVKIDFPVKADGIIFIAKEFVALLNEGKISMRSKLSIAYGASDIGDFKNKEGKEIIKLFKNINCSECLRIVNPRG